MMTAVGNQLQHITSRDGEPIGPDDRLLAEATAYLAQFEQNGVDDRDANQLAIEADDNIEHRIMYRARALPTASVIRTSIHEVRRSASLVIVCGVVLALFAGAAAARGSLAGNNGVVNIYWAVAGLLGFQSFMLLLWFGLLLLSRRQPRDGHVLAIGTLGGLVMRVAQWLAAKAHHSAHHAAAASAILHMQVRSSVGRWVLSALSHALWVSFNVGTLAMLILLLSARQYTFVWETTILSPDQYVPLTEALAVGPRTLGFATPTREQIEASSLPVNDPTTRQAWSSFLLGIIVLYGFAPRLLLLGLCMGLRRREIKRYRLNLERPDFLALRNKLMPNAQRLGVVISDDDDRTRVLAPPSPQSVDARPIGRPAILGFEIAGANQTSNWPPPVHAVQWENLGFVDHGEDQRRVLSQLASSPESPSALVVVCSLTTTPDRGVAAFLKQLQQATPQRTALVLSGGEALRHRADFDGVQRRIADWRSVAQQAGVPNERVIEVDLDHFTQASSAKLASLVHGSARPTGSFNGRRLDQAFEIIAAQRAFSQSDQANLHRRIMGLYRDDAGHWKTLGSMGISVNDLKPANLQQTIKNGASRFVDLLPPQYRLNPRWIAAGAAAGALSCIAAATLIAPAAIAALPLWTALGASITGIVRPLLHKSIPENSSALDIEGMAHAIRSATLLALVLELQSHDEASITRVLNETIDDDADRKLQSADDVRHWLDQVKRRFDASLAGLDLGHSSGLRRHD